MALQETIEKFKEKIHHITALGNSVSLMHWDGATGAPKNGVDYRSRNIGLISSEIFKMSITDDGMKDMINELYEHKEELDDLTYLCVKYYKEEIEKLKKIPPEDYRRYMELKVKASHVWEEAREKSDFNMFAPYLQQIVDYNKKFISYRGYVDHPYNTLLDDYEKGMTIDILDEFFNELKATIVPLVKKINTEGRQINADLLFQNYDKEGQEKLSYSILKRMGFDLDSGMLKESAHPFTLSLNIKDVRITTRYLANNVASAMFSTLHEGGHGLYEQNIDIKYEGTPIAEGTSMGIHESQSRFYENILGRNYYLWTYLYPELQGIFKDQLGQVSLEDFYLAINKAEPSLIRVEADELTYSLHIMVRYEIEKGLMDGSILVEDLPQVWNEKYKEYLGIEPSHDGEGVLQDVHWSDGLFGYFPSYALGNAFASQFAHVMEKSLNIDSLLEEGNFQPINDWLKEQIHQYGKSETPEEILKRVTGEGLNPRYFTDYLHEKYSKIYFG